MSGKIEMDKEFRGVAYNPNNGMITVMLSNYGDNVWSRMRKIREKMYDVSAKKHAKNDNLTEKQ
ncbi:MAG: hypothetical protein J6S50_10235 [Oscillospiraceae bacterium]|nr:hypothetical protein [Oscillospiraceae bacterium]